MSQGPTAAWGSTNQAQLVVELERLAALLEARAAAVSGAGPAPEPPPPPAPDEPPSALTTLAWLFGLSPFERDVLLLCAAVELDGRFPHLCAAAQDNPACAYPTFSLALAALPEAHWDALAPTGALRRWRLIELGPGQLLTTAPLRASEQVVHYLTGLQELDARLLPLLEPVAPPEELAPSQDALADELADQWRRATGWPLPLAQLCGEAAEDKGAIAATACARLGLRLYALGAEALPAGELEELLGLWRRDAAMLGAALLVDADDAGPPEGERARALARLIEQAAPPLVIATRERRAARRPAVTFEVRRPLPAEQRAIWQRALGPHAAQLNGQLDQIASQFSLAGGAISAAAADLARRVAGAETPDLAATVWEVCRTRARARLDDLAQRIEPAAAWDDLVLPEGQRLVLRTIAAQVRQRATVYEQWGFGGKGGRGLGISALFAGPSGTGKTTAAEVLAGVLRLDLYKIDLSAVVSKYIGETEKNLRRIFDAAEAGGAILLFDEADALFGKRSEVKDSHDRYANIEVSYLLQLMEQYRGLAVLTTNMRHALDQAFLRRIRFVVQFPFPDRGQRAEIWRRAFPAATPTAGLDVARLAQLNVTGGNIRNIALNAAFLAADAGEPVGMAHLLQAARVEYAKQDKTLADAEITGWV